MATVDYGAGPVEVRANLHTLTLYERRFGGNMLGELFGKVTVGEDESDGRAVLSFDYGSVDWAALTRALWACMRTADRTVPDFDEWAGAAGDVNLFDIRAQLLPAIDAGLFRAGAADPA